MTVPAASQLTAVSLFDSFRSGVGRIVSVEALGAFLPYGTKSGWIE
ncbi:MAG TPA: hypothetical protein VIC34_06015 [Croceibacterium sp.]